MKQYNRHYLLWNRFPRNYSPRSQNNILKHREYIIDLVNYLSYKDVD